jgi:ion channel-forming bestrophin family protein
MGRMFQPRSVFNFFHHLYYSTSYDRYWEGRNSFAALTSNIRNLSRQIWVNVALPPADSPPAHSRGKTPTSELMPSHLRKKKIEALRLCLSFAFSVKHYLRGEDGVNWEDYHGVLPASFAHFDEICFNIQRTDATKSYAATRNSSTSQRDGDPSLSGRTTPDGTKPDATKRVRVKRSKQQIFGPTTPLLGGTHHSMEFHPCADEASLPLPLVLVPSS